MINRLFLILLPFCSLSHAMASEVTDYLQEQAQALVLMCLHRLRAANFTTIGRDGAIECHVL